MHAVILKSPFLAQPSVHPAVLLIPTFRRMLAGWQSGSILRRRVTQIRWVPAVGNSSISQAPKIRVRGYEVGNVENPLEGRLSFFDY